MSIVHAMLMFVSLPCHAPDPAKQITQEEITLAMGFSHLQHQPATVRVAATGCIDEMGRYAGFYMMGLDFTILDEDFRDDGGLTVLVHELRHAYQDQNGEPGSECDAADYGARFAYTYGYWDRWAVEFIYGTEHCVGGKLYGTEADGDGVLPQEFWATIGFLTVFPEMIGQREHSPIWDYLDAAMEGKDNVDGD